MLATKQTTQRYTRESIASLTAEKKKELIRLLEIAEQNKARDGLTRFACYVDPAAAKWYRAQHLRRIASLLEQVERGDIKRLIISVPPRHWKSSLASEKFPSWYLGRHNEAAIILASYGLALAEKFSRSVREIIAGNPLYSPLFPNTRIRRDSNRADDWLLDGGTRSSFRAVGVGGGITGHGANLVLIDDPISDYEAAQSETQRENLWEWYRQVLRTRLEPGGAIVLIQTRWHEDDLAGRLIQAEKEQGGERWTVVNLPAQDENGNYLWLDRFNEAEYEAIKASVGDYAWRSLYCGAPSQPAGNIIKREWFEYVPQLPIGAQWKVRAWDGAWTEKQSQKHNPDYTATVKAVVANDILYLGEPRLFRLGIEQVAEEMIRGKMGELSVRYGMGKLAVKASLVKMLNAAGFSIESYSKNEDTDKIARASGWIARASTGHVKLVGTEKEWEEFTSQWWAFPTGAHDDAVDAVSGCAAMLSFAFVSVPKPQRRPPPFAFVDKM